MPELYQLIGAVLRDVAQARYMSDRYSRQISFQYEQDSLLRQFPVPRVEIDEIEFDLHFAVTSVEVDPHRHTSRNAAIGSLFDTYSASITREGLGVIRARLQARAGEFNDTQKAEMDRLEKTFFADETLEKLRGRLLRFFNENADTLLLEDGTFNNAPAEKAIEEFARALRREGDMTIAESLIQLPADASGMPFWDSVYEQAEQQVMAELKHLGADVQAVAGKYVDYLVSIDVSPEILRSHPAVSSIRVKSAVKNYRWSKVDVDSSDMRNIRSLSPE